MIMAQDQDIDILFNESSNTLTAVPLIINNPGEDKVSNWLPAHNGPFSLQARLYWPNPENLDPLYVLPSFKKINY